MEDKLKAIRIEQANNGMYYAKFNGGGVMPRTLTGLWTNYKELERKIEHYLSERKPQNKVQRAVAKKVAETLSKAEE